TGGRPLMMQPRQNRPFDPHFQRSVAGHLVKNLLADPRNAIHFSDVRLKSPMDRIKKHNEAIGEILRRDFYRIHGMTALFDMNDIAETLLLPLPPQIEGKPLLVRAQKIINADTLERTHGRTIPSGKLAPT